MLEYAIERHPREAGDDPCPLHVSSYSEANVLFLALSGELDLYTVGELWRAIKEGLMDLAITEIVVDMRAAPFVDSSGYGAFINAAYLLRPRCGCVHLAGCIPSVTHMLSVLRLSRVFRLYPTTGAARHGAMMPRHKPGS